MTRLTRVFFLLLFLSSLPEVFALDIPDRPDAYVTDRAALLSPATRTKLEALLRSYESQTTNQIVVVTFPSLEGESLEDFSIRLAEAWKVGQKGRDNGVIFLVFRDDRKMRIEVGYGLEGTLPDALAGQIIQQIVAPLFREGEYEKGVLAGTAAILKATQGEFQAAPRRRSPGYGRRPLTPAEQEALRAQGRALGIFILILVVLFFIIDFFRYRRYRYERRIYRDRYSFWEWWFRFAILLAVLSILFRILFYMMLFSRGGYYGGRGGFGGFRGGGGSFGGGGASGGW